MILIGFGIDGISINNMDLLFRSYYKCNGIILKGLSVSPGGAMGSITYKTKPHLQEIIF